jgi:Ca2+-binding EF-hand superfamily protein
LVLREVRRNLFFVGRVAGMKKKLMGIVALATLAGVVLILPSLGVGQQPGGGKGQKGQKGQKGFGGPGGGMQMDPNKLFDFMAKGNDYILINDMRQGKDDAMEWAQQNGITSGQLTREQFAAYMNYKLAQGIPGGPGGGKVGNQQLTPEQIDEKAIGSFKRADKNGDGLLNEDEMSNNLKQVWKMWDANKDGVIDLEEYKAYFRDLMAKRQQDNQTDDTAAKVDPNAGEDWEKRPTVYRAGHLPKELPAWFAAYDTDQDGQVGLYEWRRAGQTYERFQEMDRNGDGLLTAEEVLYFMKLHPEVYGPVRTETDSTFVTMNNTWQQWQPPQQQQWQGKGGMGGPGKGKGGFGGQMGMGLPGAGMNPQWQNNPQMQQNNPRVGRGYDPNNPQGSGNNGQGGPGKGGGGGNKKGKGGGKGGGAGGDD